MNPSLELTVAALVERRGRFLVVEELVDGRRVINQPAGHVEPGESLVDAVIRECREETAWGFVPEAVTGIYLWSPPGARRTYLRVAFAGHVTDHAAAQPLDAGILRALWLDRHALARRRSTLRSPMVLRGVDDHRGGRRLPLDVITHLDVGGLAERAAAL